MQAYSHSYLCNLIMPLVESYWLSLVYLIDNKDQEIDEDSLYFRIQWLAETLHEEGQCRFYESCSLDLITNAIRKFTKIGFLERSEKPG